MTKQLPERPNLEQLKKQAKNLLRAAQAEDLDALARFRILPSLASKSAGEMRAAAALHDAQSVIAREHGFASWNALREHVEEALLSFAAALDEFVRCATGDAPGRAQRLLALHPALARASLHTALVLGDAEAVHAALRERPELATEPGGVQGWVPLLYVCHTCLHRGDAARTAGLVEIARRLLELGANPNAEFVWQWHPELPRTALWGAACAMRHLELAAALLAAGANPTDGVTTHIAAGSGMLDVLELLHRYRVDVNGIPGGVPPLAYLLGFSRQPDGARWLLEHGADANLAWAVSGEAPLHVAARRWDVLMSELLVQHGADPQRPRADGRTAHALAALHGNAPVAAWLLQHGARDELSPLDRFVAAAAAGDRAGAEAMVHAQPALRTELRAEHHLLLHRPAESGNAAVLATMLACGFDPNAKDRDGVTALHRAAMGGHVEAVRVLLQFGAPVNALDGMFAATPLIWAVEGRGHRQQPGLDHVGVARELIAGGSSLDWDPPAATPGPERVFEALAELRREVAKPPEP